MSIDEELEKAWASARSAANLAVLSAPYSAARSAEWVASYSAKCSASKSATWAAARSVTHSVAYAACLKKLEEQLKQVEMIKELL